MISCNRLGNNGRLGNELFQWASVTGIAKSLGTKAVFPEWKYSQYFENAPETGTQIKSTIKEKHYHYDLSQFKDGYNLEGYFQSYKYFNGFKPIFKQSFLDTLQKPKGKVAAIHVRKGDYVNNPNYYQLPIEYYYYCLSQITYDTLLIFTDDKEYCKIHFECLNPVYANGNEIEDLALMSMCDYIVMSNSSYSWWGAYLSNAKVFHCGKLFVGKMLSNSIKDFYLPQWTKVDFDKYDLSDVTFIIPVLYDHEDRKQNLETIVNYLKRFKTNIIIGEQGGNKFEYLPCKYMKFDYPVFHRTKMLNAMTDKADTPIVFNYDADVLFSPIQIIKAVNRMREGIDFVYPYDGRFVRIPKSDINYRTYKDVGFFKGRYTGDEKKESVGGCIGYLKKSFIEAGGENERFVSYAPEDMERCYRFKKLGYKVEFIDGKLFHLDHFVGDNSSARNKFFPANNKEWELIKKLTPGQIRERVKWEINEDIEVKYSPDLINFTQNSFMTFKPNPKKIGATVVTNRTVIKITQHMTQEQLLSLYNNPKTSHLVIAEGLPEPVIDVIEKKKEATTTLILTEQPKDEKPLSNQPEAKESKRKGRPPMTAKK